VFSHEGDECENRLKNDLGELRETVTELRERFRQIESSLANLASTPGSSTIPTPTALQSSSDSPPSSSDDSDTDSDSSRSASVPLDVELCAGFPTRFPIKDGEPLNGILFPSFGETRRKCS
jgi:hypothetical protein